MRVAAIQTTAGPDRTENLDAATPLVEGAAARGAELVVLPEYFSVAGSAAHLRAHAEDLAGPTVTWASELAARLDVALVAGSFPERSTDPAGKVSNTSCLVGPSGTVEALYRKIHLFDVELDGTTVQESAAIAAGDRLCVLPLAKYFAEEEHVPVLGMSICYDLRFPELYRILALEGATVVTVPAAFTAATGPPHWELLLRARAVENQIYVVAAAQVGVLPQGMPACHGHSMVVDPWGDVLAELLDDEPGFVVADVDLGRLEQVRAQLPVLAHRRPDTYRWPDAG
ncbi:MAG: carbon-nitrogen hydrolase family protein [Acidimicrobiales bacterium]